MFRVIILFQVNYVIMRKVIILNINISLHISHVFFTDIDVSDIGLFLFTHY